MSSDPQKVAILRALRAIGGSAGSADIARHLADSGLALSPRGIRLHLAKLEEEGLVLPARRGRTGGRNITPQGLAEIQESSVLERIGFMSSKVDRMTYRMTFDLASRTGTVVVNMTLLRVADLCLRMEPFLRVFEKGYAMGTLMGLLPPGAQLEGTVIPPGLFGLLTVCSVSINGVLLKHGIPTRSLFSGLLELRDGKAQRFSEIISYDATSLDPLELFIRAGLTDYMGAINTGNGRIGAGFREVPAESHPLVERLAEKVRRIGLGAILEIGRPGQAVLNVPVREGSCGVVVIGGLNPVSVFEETGIRVTSRALSGTYDFQQLFPYQELPARLAASEGRATSPASE